MSNSKRVLQTIVTSAAVICLMAGSQVQAGFVLTETSFSINGAVQAPPTLANPATVAFTNASGTTTIGLAPLTPQTFTGSSGVNLLDVSASSTNTNAASPNSGTFTFSETFSLVGTGASAGLNEIATLSGTFNLTSGMMGAITSNMGSFGSPSSSIAVTVQSGSGYSFSTFVYAQPSPGSSVGSASAADGGVSLNITTAVPEPASLAMLGLGLVGVGIAAARRRRASK